MTMAVLATERGAVLALCLWATACGARAANGEPHAPPGPGPDSIMVVDVLDAGARRVDGVAVAESDLSTTIADHRGDRVVVVRARSSATWVSVVDALDAVARASGPVVRLALEEQPARISGDLHLPRREPGVPRPVVVVDVDAQGTLVSVDGEAVDRRERTVETLRVCTRPDAPVVIRADGRAPFGKVLDTVVWAQSLGCAVAFGVAPSLPQNAVGGVLDGLVSGTAPPPARPPRAKLRARDWECPFPPQADVAGIDEAIVLLQVNVDASGHATGVTILKDPGSGFADAARACARSAAYDPAVDTSGRPTEAATGPIRIRFERPPAEKTPTHQGN
jgi:protein TonB